MAVKKCLTPQDKLELVRGARRLSRRLPPLWDRRVRELGKAVLDYRGARSSYLRATRFALLGRGSRLLLAPFGRGELLVDAADREIGRAVFVTGGYERVYMETALALLVSSTASPPARTTFVDVGANIGTSTVDALLHFGFDRAVCFEPDERNARLLEMNLVLNGLAGRVEVHRAALSDRDGEALLRRSSSNFGDHRLVPGARQSGEPGARQSGEPGAPPQVARVPCARLDSVLARSALPVGDVGLVWIDAQGHEPFVLSGAMTLMEAGVPIVLEYSPEVLYSSGGLNLLEELVGRYYGTIVDVRLVADGLSPAAASLDAGAMATLRGRHDDIGHTDLLLLP